MGAALLIQGQALVGASRATGMAPSPSPASHKGAGATAAASPVSRLASAIAVPAGGLEPSGGSGSLSRPASGSIARAGSGSLAGAASGSSSCSLGPRRSGNPFAQYPELYQPGSPTISAVHSSPQQ